VFQSSSLYRTCQNITNTEVVWFIGEKTEFSPTFENIIKTSGGKEKQNQKNFHLNHLLFQNEAG